jgi:hypothetical protein
LHFYYDNNNNYYYLGILLSGTAVFVDRAGNYFRPSGAEAIARALRPGTVLDGEIVFNLHYRKHVFLVFDVLANEGEACSQLPFESRLSLISSFIFKKLGGIDFSLNKATGESPLWIIRKVFRRKHELKDLMKLMVNSLLISFSRRYLHHRTTTLTLHYNLACAHMKCYYL